MNMSPKCKHNKFKQVLNCEVIVHANTTQVPRTVKLVCIANVYYVCIVFKALLVMGNIT